jgi:hypothetical protein
VVIAPSSANFGREVATASTHPRQFVATNKSLVPAVIGTVTATFAPASPFKLVADKCSTITLDPKKSCTMNVIFAPITVGDAKDSLSLPYNNPNPATAALEGTGIAVTLTAPASVAMTAQAAR